MKRNIFHNDQNILWEGIISLEMSDGRARPLRIPHETRHLFSPVLAHWAEMTAGVALRFQSDSTEIRLEFDCPEDSALGRVSRESHPYWAADKAYVDLYLDDQFIASEPAANMESITFSELGSEMKEFQIWLPHVAKFTFKGLEVDSTSEFCLPKPKIRSKWITYGSSATQCVGAEKPSRTWPAIIARSLDLELIALGYGGNCHLDPMVARMIRDQSADCISLCLGANVYMQSSLNERTLGSSVLAFIDIIRETNPEVPMIVMSPYHMGEKETTPNLVGLTVQDIRIEIQKAVEVVQNAGDEYISYITGLNILGPECKDLLPDGLHANAEGYKIIADKIFPLISAALDRWEPI